MNSPLSLSYVSVELNRFTISRETTSSWTNQAIHKRMLYAVTN